MPTATIITIGNEVLNGTTRDTNSSWMCQQVTGRGAQVLRVTILPDVVDEISQQIEQDLKRSVDLIVTLGGLGPTRDDLTLVAVAKACNVALETSEEALKIVDERYASLEREGRIGRAQSIDAERARRKMGELPRGSKPIFNPVGAAPAVETVIRGTTILSLPGVPRETQAIVADHAVSTLSRTLGTGVFRSIVVETGTNDESHLAGVLKSVDIAANGERVYVKSRARRFGSDVRMNITLSKGGDDVALVNDSLERVLKVVEMELEKLGVTVLSIERG